MVDFWIEIHSKNSMTRPSKINHLRRVMNMPAKGWQLSAPM
jgi:hypothetical protein